jgi:5-methylcytosine-specific restriction endonuclease McrA
VSPADYLTCRFCGVAFERPRKPGHPPAYCSNECRREQHRARSLANYYAHVEARRAYAKEWTRQNPERARERPSAQPKARRERYAEKRGGDMRQYVCAVCDVEFERPHKPGRPPTVCSSECAAERNRRKAKQYARDNPLRVAARPSSATGYRKERNAAYYETNREREIQRSLAYARDAGRDAKRAQDARRRALKRGSALPGELFTLDDIFDRDRGICHLCGQAVDRHRNATMDHVIPITRGGPHTLANVKLAHRGCNTRKGNRILAA